MLVAIRIAERRYARSGHDPSVDRRHGRRGRPRRSGRSARLPPLHGLRLGQRRPTGSAEDLGGRAQHLGRRGRGHRRRRGDRPPAPDRRAPSDGRHGPGGRRRAGDRSVGQLVQPGALRQADGSALGPGDRPGAPARQLPRPGDVPPDVPVRVALVPARLRHDRRGRAALPPQAWPAGRSLHRDVHVRQVLLREHAGRPGQQGIRDAVQRPAERGPLHRSDHLVRDARPSRSDRPEPATRRAPASPDPRSATPTTAESARPASPPISEIRPSRASPPSGPDAAAGGERSPTHAGAATLPALSITQSRPARFASYKASSASLSVVPGGCP